MNGQYIHILTHNDFVSELFWLLPEAKSIRTQRIALTRIKPTQDSVDAVWVQHYLKRKRMTGEGGTLAVGMRFQGSSETWLIDGHHRWVAAHKRQQKTMRLEVHHFEITYAQALEQLVRDYRARMQQFLEQARQLAHSSADLCNILVGVQPEEIEQEAA